MMLHVSRRLVGTALGLLAAAAAVWSVFLSWYAGRKGSNIRIQDMFSHGLSMNSASTMNSLFLPLAFAALLVLVFAVLGWRWLPVLGGLLCLATALLWGTRQAQTADGLRAGLVGHGPQLAAVAGVALIVAAVLAPPRLRTETAPVVTAPGESTGTDVAGADDAYSAGYRDARAGIGADSGTDADATRLTPTVPEPEPSLDPAPGEATEELPRRERTTPAP
jgi:hypothetical protein